MATVINIQQNINSIKDLPVDPLKSLNVNKFSIASKIKLFNDKNPNLNYINQFTMLINIIHKNTKNIDNMINELAQYLNLYNINTITKDDLYKTLLKIYYLKKLL
jgi:hypothetical protein